MNQKSPQYDESVTAKRNALKEAFRRAEQIELEMIPDDYEWEFSPRFEMKMKQLIREQRRGKATHVLHMAGAKVAAVCAAVCLITVCLLSVSAVKEPVSNLSMSPHKNDSILTMKEEYDLPGGGTAIAPNSIETAYLPAGLPEGYVLTESHYASLGNNLEWVDSNNVSDSILFSQGVAYGTTIVNTEFAEVSSAVVHDHKGFFIKNHWGNMLYWDEYGYLFSLHVPPDMPDAEVLALAESLKADNDITKLVQEW